MGSTELRSSSGVRFDEAISPSSAERRPSSSELREWLMPESGVFTMGNESSPPPLLDEVLGSDAGWLVKASIRSRSTGAGDE